MGKAIEFRRKREPIGAAKQSSIEKEGVVVSYVKPEQKLSTKIEDRVKLVNYIIADLKAIKEELVQIRALPDGEAKTNKFFEARVRWKMLRDELEGYDDIVAKSYFKEVQKFEDDYGLWGLKDNEHKP